MQLSLQNGLSGVWDHRTNVRNVRGLGHLLILVKIEYLIPELISVGSGYFYTNSPIISHPLVLHHNPSFVR